MLYIAKESENIGEKQQINNQKKGVPTMEFYEITGEFTWKTVKFSVVTHAFLDEDGQEIDNIDTDVEILQYGNGDDLEAVESDEFHAALDKDIADVVEYCFDWQKDHVLTAEDLPTVWKALEQYKWRS